jgi:hypothetical protein
MRSRWTQLPDSPGIHTLGRELDARTRQTLHLTSEGQFFTHETDRFTRVFPTIIRDSGKNNHAASIATMKPQGSSVPLPARRMKSPETRILS